ncbi:MAG: hypothetical protein HY952_10245 [Elusimicrobia bacterium]|nr:hypothetical protein [Elusimicrobiota bacterium]
MNEFYLISGESAAYGPIACRILERYATGTGNDYAVVTVSPKIQKSIYNTEVEISIVILVSRWEGYSLFSPSKWPIPVNVYLLKQDNAAMPERGNIGELASKSALKTYSTSEMVIKCFDINKLTLVDRGEIYISKEEARKSMVD